MAMFSRIVVLCCLIILSACNLNSTPLIETPSLEPTTPSEAITATPFEVTQEANPTQQQQETTLPIETSTIIPFADLTHPLFTVASYYNAINLRDYARAYSYWEAVPNNATLEQYTAGFSDTAHVDVIARLPIRVGVAAGSSGGDVPVLVTSTHTNGTQENFIGCMLAHITNMPTGAEQNIFDTDWGLRGDVDQFGRTGLQPTTSTNLAQLETACDDFYMETITSIGSMDDQASAPDTLVSYYNAIALGEFERAYGYWFGQLYTLDEMRTRFANINPTALIR
jgi:hypothetical protein